MQRTQFLPVVFAANSIIYERANLLTRNALSSGVVLALAGCKQRASSYTGIRRTGSTASCGGDNLQVAACDALAFAALHECMGSPFQCLLPVLPPSGDGSANEQGARPTETSDGQPEEPCARCPSSCVAHAVDIDAAAGA